MPINPGTNEFPSTDGYVVHYLRKKMAIPEGGSHCRSVEWQLPRMHIRPDPIVSATIFSPNSVGTTFAVYNIKCNDLGDKTQIAIEAANVQIGLESGLPFWCNAVVTGKPRKPAPVQKRKK